MPSVIPLGRWKSRHGPHKSVFVWKRRVLSSVFKQNRVHTLRLLIVFAQPPSLIEACAFTGIQHRDVIVFKSLRFKPSTRVQHNKVGHNRECGSQFWPPSCVRWNTSQKYSYHFLIQWKSINKNSYFPMIRQTLYPYKKKFYTVSTIHWEYKNLMTAAHV